MDKPNKPYTKKELENLYLEKIKDIARSLGIKTSRNKSKLIEDILRLNTESKISEISKTSTTKVTNTQKERGSYLQNKGEEQEFYDYLNEDWNSKEFSDSGQEQNLINFFNATNFIYKAYFKQDKNINSI